jgi:molybdenum cofactor cytidylyltransferase
MTETITGILLAAGAARRFGGGKLMHALPGGTALGVAAAQTLCAALPGSLAVVKPGDADLADALRYTGLRIVECANARLGMGASLACGIAAAGDAHGWVIALADMPLVKAETIVAVADALRAGAPLAAPVYRGERGHPVGFSARFRDELAALNTDQGARTVLQAHREELRLIDCNDGGIIYDVDQAADLDRFSNPKQVV